MVKSTLSQVDLVKCLHFTPVELAKSTLPLVDLAKPTLSSNTEEGSGCVRRQVATFSQTCQPQLPQGFALLPKTRQSLRKQPSSHQQKPQGGGGGQYGEESFLETPGVLPARWVKVPAFRPSMSFLGFFGVIF